jgi:cholesterol oxidase
MLANVFFFNVMGVDASDGQFSLEGDSELKLKINTPPKNQATFQKTEEVLRAFASAMGGKYVAFPLWEGFGHKKLISTHPIGGCRIANDRNEGVVNAKGQVFYAGSPDTKAVYPGLYVVDGSIVPNALAVNPTLTITALALKIMAQVQ